MNSKAIGICHFPKELLVAAQEALGRVADAEDRVEIVSQEATFALLGLRECLNKELPSLQDLRATRELVTFYLTRRLGRVPSGASVSQYAKAAADFMSNDKNVQNWQEIVSRAAKYSNASKRRKAKAQREANDADADADVTEPSEVLRSGITKPKGFWVLSVNRKSDKATKIALLSAFAETIGIDPKAL